MVWLHEHLKHDLVDFGILFTFPYQGGVSKNRSALFND